MRACPLPLPPAEDYLEELEIIGGNDYRLSSTIAPYRNPALSNISVRRFATA